MKRVSQCAKALTLNLVLMLAVPVIAQCQTVRTLAVSSHTDIYRAGGYDDGSDGVPPAVYSFSAAPRQILTLPRVAGLWDCGSAPPYGPDGSTTSGCEPHTIETPIGPFSGIDMTDFVGPLAGMFLEDSLPASAPLPLRFYVSDSSQGGIPTDFKILSPLIGQVFFIGNGLTGTDTGAHHVFFVPPTATHLYLGYVDSCSNSVPGCYYNNRGAVAANIQLQSLAGNSVEP
ncbi:MAG: hypothetical protein ABSH32_16035 [Bryobacteraceae bacterium]